MKGSILYVDFCWENKIQKLTNFVQQVDEIINTNTADFQNIKNINLRTALEHVDIVESAKKNSDPSPVFNDGCVLPDHPGDDGAVVGGKVCAHSPDTVPRPRQFHMPLNRQHRMSTVKQNPIECESSPIGLIGDNTKILFYVPRCVRACVCTPTCAYACAQATYIF